MGFLKAIWSAGAYLACGVFLYDFDGQMPRSELRMTVIPNILAPCTAL